MIHSASFRATGSVIWASACVASDGLCLRIRSITFSSASRSAFEVDEVAATAAGTAGLRGGKLAGRWRAAGRAAAGAAVDAVDLGPGFSAFPASLASPAAVFGATFRAMGLGFGKGTFVVAQA